MWITARERLALLAAILGGAAFPAIGIAAARGALSMSERPAADMEAAWLDLCGSLAKAAEFIQTHPNYAAGENRASGYAMMIGVLVKALEMHTKIDPDFPVWHMHDTMHLCGADNPDQRYLQTRIRGGETYRIWGHLTNEARLDVQIYAGETTSLPRSTGFLSFEEMHVEEDGTYEIILSPQRQGANWMDNPPDSARVLIRQVYSDWSLEKPGEVHIDRLGFEGARRTGPVEAELARGMREAGENVMQDVAAWANLHQTVTDSDHATPVNAIPPPASTFAQGGAKNRYMTFSIYDVTDDEALVLRWWPMGGSYQAVHLRDLWNSSLEYMNMQSSLTGEQCEASPDGSFWCVLSARDPGIRNWLDTGGLKRGYVAFRFDGIGDRPFDADKVPTLQKVRFDEIAAHLPKGTPRISATERFAQIAARRSHLQQRTHR
jgi:hypothetical protein